MVPVYFSLLVALPFAACGLPDMAQMQAMMAMMNQMEQAKLWGPMAPVVPAAPASTPPPMVMNTKEEYDAYLKWCEQNRVRQAEQMKQQQLLAQFKAKQAAAAAQAEKEQAAAEAAERQANQMAQWNAWEKQMAMSTNFDSIAAEVKALQYKYYNVVVFQFLAFCQCENFQGDMDRFFNYNALMGDTFEQFDINDLGLTAVSGQDPAVVAAALNKVSQVDQIKAFFGGLQNSMCDAAKTYIGQVMDWEKNLKFMDKLV